MNRLQTRTLFLVLGLAVIAAPAMAATAFVWATGNAGAGTAGVAAYVQQYGGCFTTVDYSDADAVPLNTLLGYDAVLYFSNSSGGQDPNAIGDELADYVAAGKHLVVATFSWAEQGSNTLGGRFITDGISPFLANGGSLYTPVTMRDNDGGCYFNQVSSISGLYHDNVILSTGAVQHATWSDNMPLLADKGNVVAIDLFPDDSFGSIGGDYKQMFGNAMCCIPGPVPVQQTTWGQVKSMYR